MEFLTPVLFGGLALVSAPILIHLLHRRNIKPVDWAAMRFLVEMMTRKRRRLLLNELLLLLVRVLIIACVAFAMVRPALRRSPAGDAGAGIVRQGRTAAVLLVDDCLSSQAGRAQSSFESMRRLAVSYLGTLAPGDEVSVVFMSQAGQPAADPVFDIEAVKSSLTAARPAFVSSDIPALIEAGLAQLKRHANSGAELVLVTDGMSKGWRFDEVSRWEELRRRLRGSAKAAPGSKERPRLIVLCPETAEPMRNISIASIAPDRSFLTAGTESAFAVTLKSRGNDAPSSARLQFSVDGRAVEQKSVEVPANGEAEATFAYSFPAPGSYSIEAGLLDNHDFLAADDQRFLSAQVEPGLSVLLVDGKERAGLLAKLGFLRYALDPQGKGAGPFKVAQVSVAKFLPSMLADYRVVVLGDVSALEPATVDALERYVVGGGGLLVGLGPESSVALVNKAWARGGEGFFPAPLAGLATPAKGSRPAGINRTHPVFAGFGAGADDAWKSASVKSYFTLAPDPRQSADLDLVLKLDHGDPLIVEKRRGLGLVALVTTSLNADWNDLPLQPAYVPLVRGLVGQLGSFITPPRNLLPGEPIIYAHVGEPGRSITGEDPTGKPLALTLGGWEGRDAILSEPLTRPGVYLLRDPRVAKPVRFAVAPSPRESALEPAPDREMAQALEPGTPILRRAEAVAEKLNSSNRQSVEIWKWLIAGAIILIFIETWMTRRAAAGGLEGGPALRPENA
jgi:hypothetical protein